MNVLVCDIHFLNHWFADRSNGAFLGLQGLQPPGGDFSTGDASETLVSLY